MSNFNMIMSIGVDIDTLLNVMMMSNVITALAEKRTHWDMKYTYANNIAAQPSRLKRGKQDYIHLDR